MNTQVGKSLGFALLMAAGLLAALFAMGVFSASGVLAGEPTFDGFNYDSDDSGTAEAYRFTLLTGSEGDANEVEDVDAVSTARGADSPVKVGTIKAQPASGESAVQYTFVGGAVGADATDANTGAGLNNVGYHVSGGGAAFRIHMTSGQIDYIGPGFAAPVIDLVVQAQSGTRDATSRAFSVGATPNTKTAPLHVIPYVTAGDSDVPGKAVRITINATLVVERRGVITVNMTGFGLPASIPNADVEIQGSQGTNDHVGIPRSISISGTKVLLTLGDLTYGSGQNPTVQSELGEDSPEAATIIFYPSAGITNPSADGKYEVTVSSAQTMAAANSQVSAQVVVVNRQISVHPKKGGRGSDFTITGKGFSSGEATVFIDNGDRKENLETEAIELIAPGNNKYDRGYDKVLGRAAITDGSFSLPVTVGESDDFPRGTNTINAIDSAGNTAIKGKTAAFTVTGSIDADPKEISYSEDVDIMLEDWDYDEIGSITFGGAANVASFVKEGETDGVTTYNVTVPPGIRPGTHQVKVNGTKIGSGSQTINIVVTPLPLTVEPESAVPGQQVTIKGTGFSGGEDVTVTVNGDVIGQKAISGSRPETNTSGNLNVTFTLPDAEDLDIGEATISAEEGTSKRTGQVKATIPEPSITLDPSESGYGSEVTVSGSGFPANESLDIEYFNADDDDFEPVGIARSDSTGNFNGSFDVPSFAETGKANEVRVMDRDEQRKAIANHTLPNESITAVPAEILRWTRKTGQLVKWESCS